LKDVEESREKQAGFFSKVLKNKKCWKSMALCLGREFFPKPALVAL